MSKRATTHSGAPPGVYAIGASGRAAGQRAVARFRK